MKDELRRQMKALRASMKGSDLLAASLAIQDRLCAMDEFKRAKRVGCYLSLACEAGTGRIISRCLQAGKEVSVPARRRMHDYGLCRFTEHTPTATGFLGIPEPSRHDWVEPESLDLIVVPGVAFDAAGRRLGHGLGCYDRLMANCQSVFKIGLAFEWQLAPEVPVDKTDIAMDAVVTERTIYRAGAEAGSTPAAEPDSETNKPKRGKGPGDE